MGVLWILKFLIFRLHFLECPDFQNYAFPNFNSAGFPTSKKSTRTVGLRRSGAVQRDFAARPGKQFKKSKSTFRLFDFFNFSTFRVVWTFRAGTFRLFDFSTSRHMLDSSYFSTFRLFDFLAFRLFDFSTFRVSVPHLGLEHQDFA